MKQVVIIREIEEDGGWWNAEFEFNGKLYLAENSWYGVGGSFVRISPSPDAYGLDVYSDNTPYIKEEDVDICPSTVVRAIREFVGTAANEMEFYVERIESENDVFVDEEVVEITYRMYYHDKDERVYAWVRKNKVGEWLEGKSRWFDCEDDVITIISIK